jgi:hypothetical protein
MTNLSEVGLVACSAFWELLRFERTAERIGRMGRMSSVFLDEVQVLAFPAKKRADGLRAPSCVARDVWLAR